MTSNQNNKPKFIAFGPGGGKTSAMNHLIQIMGGVTTVKIFSDFIDEETGKLYPFKTISYLKEMKQEELEKYFHELEKKEQVQMLKYLLTKKELPVIVQTFLDELKEKEEFKLRLIF